MIQAAPAAIATSFEVVDKHVPITYLAFIPNMSWIRHVAVSLSMVRCVRDSAMCLTCVSAGAVERGRSAKGRLMSAWKWGSDDPVAFLRGEEIVVFGRSAVVLHLGSCGKVMSGLVSETSGISQKIVTDALATKGRPHVQTKAHASKPVSHICHGRVSMVMFLLACS